MPRYLYYSEAFGASRDNEQAVVVIKCLENYDPTSHNGLLWQAVINRPHQRGMHSMTVPWQMFGSQCRNVDNRADINDNDLAVMVNNNLATVKKPQVVVMRRAGGVVADVGVAAAGIDVAVGIDFAVGDDFGGGVGAAADDIGAIVHSEHGSDNEH